MLSKDLMALAAWFNEVRNGDFEMTPQGMAAFAAELDATVDKAMALETAAAVNVAALLGEAPADSNVLPFRLERRMSIAPVGDHGGDAA